MKTFQLPLKVFQSHMHRFPLLISCFHTSPVFSSSCSTCTGVCQPTASPRANEHLSRMDRGPLQQVGPRRRLFRRGSRGGRRKQRQIQTIITRRKCVRPHSPNRTNHLNLIKIPISTSVNTASRPADLHTAPSIYIINANSIAKTHALEQLTADMLAYDIGIAIVTETKLKAKHRTETFAIKGFQLFRRDRPDRGGGEVAIYVSDKYKASECPLTEPHRDKELRVEACSPPIIVGAIYLLPMVGVPTRGEKILDMLMAAMNSAYKVKIIVSAVRSDHKAVLATTGPLPKDRTKTSKQHTFKRRTPGQHARMLQKLAALNLNSEDASDPNLSWSGFYHTMSSWLDEFYPRRTITITSRDPEFITPEIKYLLRRRNAALRGSRIEAAAALTSRIGCLINKQTSRLLSRINRAAGTKQLWSAVRNLTDKRGNADNEATVTAEDLNGFFAAASTDSEYVQPIRKTTAMPNAQVCCEADIFYILDRLRPTAEGLDNIPAWFLRLLAPVISGWIARLFNSSLNSSTIPEQWRVARIRPLAKNKPPKGPSDYRPISVVPVLSRVLERLVVDRFIYPAMFEPPMNLLILDQFAFRPSGSTTAALVDLLQKTSNLLLHHEYVLIISVDFMKAFDRVRHNTLSQKLLLLNLPDHIHNWMVDYFMDRGHSTHLADVASMIAWIDASIIQGSVVGPPSYVVAASDLHPKHKQNVITKFADDTYLLVGSGSVSTVAAQFDNIKSWAEANNMAIHPSKTKELVIYRARRRLPPLSKEQKGYSPLGSSESSSILSFQWGAHKHNSQHLLF